MKSETAFVNQLSILFHKCGLGFFGCASEHDELVRLESCYSTLPKDRLLRSRWWTLKRSAAPRSFPLIERFLVPKVSLSVKTVTTQTRKEGLSRPMGRRRAAEPKRGGASLHHEKRGGASLHHEKSRRACFGLVRGTHALLIS